MEKIYVRLTPVTIGKRVGGGTQQHKRIRTYKYTLANRE